jgi:hypothetical protein
MVYTAERGDVIFPDKTPPPPPPPPIRTPPAPPPPTTRYRIVTDGSNCIETPPEKVMPPVISNAIVLSYRFIVYLVEYP